MLHGHCLQGVCIPLPIEAFVSSMSFLTNPMSVSEKREGVNRIVTVAFSGLSRCTCNLDLFRPWVCCLFYPSTLVDSTSTRSNPIRCLQERGRVARQCVPACWKRRETNCGSHFSVAIHLEDCVGQPLIRRALVRATQSVLVVRGKVYQYVWVGWMDAG